MRNKTLTKKDYEMIASEIIRQVFESIRILLAGLAAGLAGGGIGIIIIWVISHILGTELMW